MKVISTVLIAWLVGCAAAAAQEPTGRPLTRGDVHFVLGWQNIHKPQESEGFGGDDWLNAIFYGGTGAGWYWNDHLKTQVDLGAGTHGHQYRYQTVTVGTVTTNEVSRVATRQTGLAIAQQYQFFRNQWFHPRVAGGVEIARESTTEEYQAIFAFDNATRTTRQLEPPRTESSRRTIARPFFETGFKAYMSRRAFFTADSRLMFRGGVDEVLFRLGFGVDF
jgi:outer membrane protein with beta-barrel domain